MALAQQLPSAISVADIICELEAARGRPDAALRNASEHAQQIAPAVIATIELAANGTYLLPKQMNLLFWGIHAIAAARRTELFAPLMRLLRRASEPQLDLLLGDATTETLAGILLSVFDGNSAAIMETALDERTEGLARWIVLQVLARLTFDGAISRGTTVELLGRFEREQLAPPRSLAWIGWRDAVTLLGIEELRDRMHATWHDGRNPQRKVDQESHDRILSTARAMAPGDPALFEQQGIAALDDPVTALDWVARKSEDGQEVRDRPTVRSNPDPGDIFALADEELEWLSGFFDHRVHQSSGIVEVLDGYFCGLIAGPGTPQRAEYLSKFWSIGPLLKVPGGCIFDSPEQEEYVNTLLTRHWSAIVSRLGRGRRHIPFLQDDAAVPEATAWAAGFLLGISLRMTEWTLIKSDDFIAGFIIALSALAGRDELLQRKLSDHERSDIVDALPVSVQGVYDRCHGRIDPLARRPIPPGALGMKIGRNDPCPCRSGKKYKRCCGSPDKLAAVEEQR